MLLTILLISSVKKYLVEMIYIIESKCLRSSIGIKLDVKVSYLGEEFIDLEYCRITGKSWLSIRKKIIGRYYITLAIKIS